MARDIIEGESIYIPFRNGRSINDTKHKARMYRTKEAFQRHFPGDEYGIDKVVLLEYAPVVRCKKCQFYDESGDYCNMWGECRHPDHYCEEGVREDNGKA